ncbi:hypothetical protein BGZ63DRAFT_425418 [Mariannaea sp. PMI_226]|nr:hypothetical protein BGZ63DRAFT_425418 [Mariannaea sp. PMI_226]
MSSYSNLGVGDFTTINAATNAAGVSGGVDTPLGPGLLSGNLSEPGEPARHISAINPSGYQCMHIECGEILQSKTALDLHGRSMHHQPFACSCGIRFSRSDVLERHVRTQNSDHGAYPCPYCSHHSGQAAFKRQDHLTQHLKGYHKHDNVESHHGISRVGTEGNNGFACYDDECFTHGEFFFVCKADYNKHIRQMHADRLFSCSVVGCDRTGGKGYLRKQDLDKHLRLKHMRDV